MNLFNPMIAALCLCVLRPAHGQSADNEKARVEAGVAQAVRPLMEQEGIPGMAVGVASNGQHYVFDYGVASRATGKPVTADTLFEVGSVTKTLTATLAAYAQVGGQLSLTDFREQAPALPARQPLR